MTRGLHPDALAIVQNSAGLPALSDGTVAEARRRFAEGSKAFGAGPSLDHVEDRDIPGRAGTIRCRIYRAGPQSAGVVVHMHGGGWVIGAIEDFDAYARALTLASGCTVVLPDYRLAPEHRFPAGLEDAEDIIRWAHDQRDTLGGRPEAPLIVSGDSDGANLAAVANLRLAGEVPVRLQILYYPVTDCDFETPSYRAHGEGMPLKGRDIRWFFQHYADPQDWPSADISPLRSDKLNLSPPTILITAEFDTLLDEGRAYAERLDQAGVNISYRELPGLPHGFIRWLDFCAPSRDELIRVGREIRQACGSVGRG